MWSKRSPVRIRSLTPRKAVPLNDHGRDLLDELEERTDERPFKTVTVTGARTHALDVQDVGVDGFDVMLDKIDPDWREHLTRTGA